MSSAGHILDAINRMRQNRSLRSSKRQKFKGDNRKSIYAGTRQEDKAIFKEFPESQVKAVIRQIREKAKLKKRKILIFYISFWGIIASMIIYAIVPVKNYSEKPQNKSTGLWQYEIEIEEWRRRPSDSLNFPNSKFLSFPVYYRLNVELRENGGAYGIHPPDWLGSYGIFPDSRDTIEIGKLLPRFNSVSSLCLTQRPNNSAPCNIIYIIDERNSNGYRTPNSYDQHALYISELNDGNLTKITNRRISSLRWIRDRNELLMRFYETEGVIDSIYGIYNTRTKKLKLSNHWDEG